MSSEITNKIDAFLTQAQSLLAQVHQLHSRSKASVSNVSKEIYGEIGGMIGESLLDSALGRKLGKRLTKQAIAQQEIQQLAQEEQILRRSLNGILDNLASFLNTISVKKRGLGSKGNSDVLVNKLTRIREAAKIETSLNRTITFLTSLKNQPLVYNMTLPKLLEQTRVPVHAGEKSYDILRRLENSLRAFIQVRLEQISANWWEERVPEEPRRRAEGRKLNREKLWPWHSQSNAHPIHYLDFSDYLKIITREDNWNQVFSIVFKDKEIISVKLRELEPVRNSIAHSRALSRDEADKLRLYASQILPAVERS